MEGNNNKNRGYNDDNNNNNEKPETVGAFEESRELSYVESRVVGGMHKRASMYVGGRMKGMKIERLIRIGWGWSEGEKRWSADALGARDLGR